MFWDQDYDCDQKGSRLLDVYFRYYVIFWLVQKKIGVQVHFHMGGFHCWLKLKIFQDICLFYSMNDYIFDIKTLPLGFYWHPYWLKWEYMPFYLFLFLHFNFKRQRKCLKTYDGILGWVFPYGSPHAQWCHHICHFLCAGNNK